ncbi:hypothetical protein B0A50_08280 [Salinomyces thailandicus]|uniref:Uncharacterized protein n=1 Tax=Salinomyces thailandicus TaxID=706561 RepID=A0A4U0TL02_9PEZI|nr:hypothetical protein B0A50_08280 [Salinomyces thailandica]
MDKQTEIGDQAAQELGEQTGADLRYYRVDILMKCAEMMKIRDVVRQILDTGGHVKIT